MDLPIRDGTDMTQYTDTSTTGGSRSSSGIGGGRQSTDRKSVV